MSSALLYLAIVGVWIAVLVPMWLRREHTGHFFARRRPYDEDAPDTTAQDLVAEAETDTILDDGHTTPAPRPVSPPGRRTRPAPPRRRAKIIARRRRRTTILVALLLATMILSATAATPWWIVPVPILLLAGHVMLLREAAADDARKAQAAATRARAVQALREAERQKLNQTLVAPTAEIIDFAAHAKEEIYDQYADAEKRAVND